MTYRLASTGEQWAWVERELRACLLTQGREVRRGRDTSLEVFGAQTADGNE